MEKIRFLSREIQAQYFQSLVSCSKRDFQNPKTTIQNWKLKTLKFKIQNLKTESSKTNIQNLKSKNQNSIF